MIAIEFHFLAGRYHATPWDAQVNEGLVEWPPSPWRLLRTLISTWHLKAQEDVAEDALIALITKLSGELPVFSLPMDQVSLAHTRHYMPLYRASLDGKTTKIFDTFVRLSENGPVTALWQVTGLNEDERRTLEILAGRIGYLGRAESWVEGRVKEGSLGLVNTRPLEENEPLSSDEEAVRILAPYSEDEYRIWRQGFLDGLEGEAKNTKLLSKMLPQSIYSALQLDTATLKQQGWSQPPGSKFVLYRRPRLQPEIRFKALSAIKEPETLPTAARFALASAVPPRLTEALSVADRIRKALMARSDGAPVFSGKDEHGVPLKMGHQHTHILCESHGRRGTITHVTLYAPRGFDQEALVTISGLEKVWGRGGHDLQLVYLGCASPQDFVDRKTRTGGGCSLFATSQVWVSSTPFVPTRLPKYNRNRKPRLDENGLHQGTPEHDLRRLLRLDGKPEPVEIEPLAFTFLGNHKTRWLEFIRSRKKGQNDERRLCYGFRIVFPEPVQGPIALGYGSHLGLGLFVPD